MKAKIEKILEEYLNSIYCHNCQNVGNDSICENCHRKNIGWKISDGAKSMIADDIQKLFSNVTK